MLNQINFWNINFQEARELVDIYHSDLVRIHEIEYSLQSWLIDWNQWSYSLWKLYKVQHLISISVKLIKHASIWKALLSQWWKNLLTDLFYFGVRPLQSQLLERHRIELIFSIELSMFQILSSIFVELLRIDVAKACLQIIFAYSPILIDVHHFGIA